MEQRDPVTEGTSAEAFGEAPGLETAETTSGIAAFLAIVNATMLLAGGIGLITGLLVGILIGRRAAPAPPPAWRRFQR